MWKWLTALAIMVGLLGVAYFVYSRRSTPCDGIVQETIPGLASDLATFNAYGEAVIGREKVQNVDADSQKVGALLKTCCISQHNSSMKPEQHQACLDGAKKYEAKLAQTSKVFEEVDEDSQQGKLHEMDDKVTEAQKLVDEAAVIVRDLAALVEAAPSAHPAQANDQSKP